MTATKTNERPGTRAQVRYVRVSAYKAREVLDLVRGLHVADADQVLAFTERDVARIVRKALASAVANAEANDSQDGETLKVVACYADEGPTLKRWRPRARGRATRIRKRTCHITVIVGRMDDDELRRWREKNQVGLTTEGGRGGRRRRSPSADRRARVARSRQADQVDEDETSDDAPTEEASADDATDEEATPAAEVTEAEADVDDAVGSQADPDDEVEATTDDDTAAEADDDNDDTEDEK
ncbi:50S ribosomal protein L22 [Iamia majanohamensis]|uniref:50S ribosomal protein L22 n=1 Tax=Iamia majanohamensis TaxID=467976 RepID=UPI003AF2C79F